MAFYTDEKLLHIIREAYQKKQRIPKARELSQYHTIINRFGSYDEALKLAGLDPPKRSYTSQELYQLLHQWVINHGDIPTVKEWNEASHLPSTTLIRNKLKMDFSSFIKSAGYTPRKRGGRGEGRKKHTNQDLIDMLHQWVATYGDIPTMKQWNDNDNLPSIGLVRYRFGSWLQFIVAAGYSPRKAVRSKNRKVL